MARTVSNEVLTAITAKETYKLVVKAMVDPSRSYFSEITTANDKPYDAGDYSVPTDTPVGQCVVYSPTREGLVTFVADKTTGAIYAMDQGSVTKNDLSLTATTETKPAVSAEVNGECLFWFWNGTMVVHKVIDMSDFSVSAGNYAGRTLNPGYWDVTKGSPHWLDGDRLIFTYQTSKGGLGVAFHDGTSFIHWLGRFISPNTKTDNGYWTIYSTATIHNGKILVYAMDLTTGEVRGVEYDEVSKSWSDTFIALPADLSRFCVANCFSANGYVHMAGQFHRTDDLADAQVYSMVVRSKDGRAFSWDRFTLISKLGYRFYVTINTGTGKLYASDRNSVGEANLSYFFTSTPPDRVILTPPNDIVEFSAGTAGSGTLRIKSYDEEYIDHDVIKKGSRCKVYIGYATSEEEEDYEPYMTYIIDSIGTGYADGARKLTISLVAEGIWKTDQIAFPFYSELISKSTMLDDCDELDRLYPATGGTAVGTTLMFDFWDHDGWDGGGITTCTEGPFHTGKGEGCERSEWTGAYDRGWRSEDLEDIYFVKHYPKIVDTSVTVGYYGWCRTSSSGRENDIVTLYIVTEDEDNNETERSGTLTSTHGRLQRDYPSFAAGSYPVEYTFSGLTVGHIIKYVAIKQTGVGTGSTLMQPERLEINGIQFNYSNLNSNKPWLQTKPSTYGADDPTLLEVPEFGVPFVQFLLKPYAAFNFNVWANFVYEAGDEPAGQGTIGWGVVGMARDGTNYILARQNKTKDYVQLVMVRDAEETVLGQVTPANTVMALMLEHRDGIVTVCEKVGNVWESPPVITHYWDESANDVISTSETGIMHVGIYGAKATPGFRHCSLNIHDADGIGALPGEEGNIVGFPTNGKLIINGARYAYSGKTPSTYAFGPWQARNTGLYNGKMAVEISHYGPSNSSSMLSGYLLCAHTGHSWLINSTDWSVTHYNAGTPNPLRNRCRHYGTSINDNHVGTAHRMYEAPGLKNLVLDEQMMALMHPHGHWAFQWGTEQIWVQRVLGTSIDHDATVKDMTRYICSAASIVTDYPGDWTNSSQAIGASPVQLASGTRLFPGGMDIHFTLPDLPSASWIAIYADNLWIGDPDDEEAIDIGFTNVGGKLRVSAVPKDSGYDPVYIDTQILANNNRDVRILFHSEHLSIYIDNRWVVTFSWPEDDLTWPQDQVNLYAYAIGDYTLTDVTVTELFDWREAIYVESEMSAASAIGSVIQERPIEIFPTTEGGLSFSYNIVRDTITYTQAISKRIIREHDTSEGTSQDAGSDAIVYFKDVAFASDLNFADSEGFITRVMKLAGLDTGAKVAAQILLEKANERQYIHQLRLRPDVRLETGDKLIISYTLVGTGTTIDATIIIEDTSMRLMEGISEMLIRAREDI